MAQRCCISLRYYRDEMTRLCGYFRSPTTILKLQALRKLGLRIDWSMYRDYIYFNYQWLGTGLFENSIEEKLNELMWRNARYYGNVKRLYEQLSPICQQKYCVIHLQSSGSVCCNDSHPQHDVRCDGLEGHVFVVEVNVVAADVRTTHCTYNNEGLVTKLRTSAISTIRTARLSPAEMCLW